MYSVNNIPVTPGVPVSITLNLNFTSAPSSNGNASLSTCPSCGTHQASKTQVLNAFTTSLGPDAVATVESSKAASVNVEETSEKPTTVPVCITQKEVKNNPAAILIGEGTEIPRWKKGTVIRFTTLIKMGFDSKEDAEYATKHLITAASEWNKLNLGVRFEYVDDPSTANFVLVHGGDQGSTLAMAYFPNPRSLNYVYVYTAAYKAPGWKPNMWKVFCHELGHVLGLRHEFALEREKGMPAVRLGAVDPLSVMTYRADPPTITENDIKYTQLFYSLPATEVIGGLPIHDYSPALF
eukprot:TRINITY_DN10647_c0_g1_i1.p1 TRINITY_DN10647_c0_g1~~TRINITY_DN10647_c0_g1_i1.p1  ORF type:complete len:312 (-),score=73.36 TRINITY_DN10647_c0_g1_i1:55-939(-)